MISWSKLVKSLPSVFVLTLVLILTTPTLSFRLPKRDSRRFSPVILVPGDGGSQLEAKLDKPSTVHYFCNKKTDNYFDIWLNLELLVPYVLDCWVDNMRMVYDNITRTTSNAPGVDIRVPGFGNTSTVEYLDPSDISPTFSIIVSHLGEYFKAIVEALVSIGYTRGIDVRGAPYDYRKAPNEMSAYYIALKAMTEETYNKNNQTEITYVCHSMGCPIMLYFFNHQTQEWKNTYVKALVSLGGAWGGAVKALKAFASGENLGVYVINNLKVRKEQRTCPSLAYMCPTDKFWWKNETLVVTEKKNYTIANYYDFFHDIDWDIGYEMLKDTYNLTKDLIPPGVEVHCLHGVNQKTIDMLIYPHGKFPDGSPDLIFGDGDGTVNLRSLMGCKIWQDSQTQKVVHVPLKDVDHMGVLSNIQVLEYIKKLVIAF